MGDKAVYGRLWRVLIVGVVVGAGLVAAVPSQAADISPGLVYVNVSDGTSIAVNIQFPPGERPAGGWPTVIQIDGYEGATGPDSPGRYGNQYATAHMSLRGTGCSGGAFNLFDRRSSRDGREVIEWLAQQPWSDGGVAIWGHSYSGITGWLVASTFAEEGVQQPIPLKAISVSGLIDDLYRGIVYMGGVSNLGFPLVWTGAYRPAIDVGTGTAPQFAAGDVQCVQNVATRPPEAETATENAIVSGAAKQFDSNDPWWTTRAAISYLPAVASLGVPVHIVQSYQDEQTGPRGSNLLWQKLDEYSDANGLGLPLRLVLTNGVHSTNTTTLIQQDRTRWFDRYVRGDANGIDTEPRVKVWLETHQGDGHLVPNGVIDSDDWPLSQTDWQRWYFGAGTLSPDASTAQGAADQFVTGTKRSAGWAFYANGIGGEVTTASGPDQLRYLTEPFSEPSAIAGPIDVSLFLASTAPDTELFVELSDVAPDGTEMRLQRGMLKTSHRDYNPALSDYNAAGDLIRPWRVSKDTITNLLTPAEVYRLEVEVFPVGHVFRPGHRLLVRVTSPPFADSLNAYVGTTAPAVNFLYHDAERQSSVLLPIVPVPADLGPELPCGAQVGLERCVVPPG